jgi:hypothetical protein
MIANRHFCWPPTIPTLVRARSRRRPREAELHAENQGGIDRSADRPVADRVGRVAMTSARRIDGAGLEPKLTSNGGPK